MYKLLEKISITCISLIAVILILDYNYALLGVNTIFALLYAILVFFASIWATFMVLQNILSTNTPFKTNTNQFLRLLHSPLQKIEFHLIPKEVIPIDERILHFVSDIEETCIRKWYSNYISTDEQFLNECSKLVDTVVRRFLQISRQINTDKLLHGIVTILLRHVKEYRKAVRKAKVQGSVEQHYRYAHVGSTSQKNFESFAIQITAKTLRHFIHWELYNSLACTTLKAILARKLVSQLVQFLAAPGFINYRVLMLVDPKDEYLKYRSVSIGDVDHAKVNEHEKTVIEKVSQEIPKMEEQSGTDCRYIQDENPPIDAEKTEVVEQPKELEEKVEVRVYESRSANKTWRNSSDLDCISLGQDILFLSNIAEEEVTSATSATGTGTMKHPDWAKFAENFKIEKGTKEVTKVVKHPPSTTTTNAQSTQSTHLKHQGTASVKETMKDLQHTTSQAIHKIEDEAVEGMKMVEGIFDMGMAGIRKGLRLTGLQDNVLETRPKSECKDIPKSNKTRLTKLSHVSSDEDDKFLFKSHLHKKEKDKERDEARRDDEKESIEEEEDIYINPLSSFTFSKTDKLDPHTPSYEGDILLEKSPLMETRTSSNESNNSIIPTMEFLHVEDSPELEYEENPDLATTTAKLRSLLAQKTEANTPAASPISLLPTPQDASGSSIDDLSEVDRALPSMYKALSKTATGLFQNTLNSIKKTALPGNPPEEGNIPVGAAGGNGKPLQMGYSSGINWTFIEEEPKEHDLDNAFEAVEAMELGDHIDSPLLVTERKYEEELDDFDTKIPITKAVVDLICELIEETHPPLVKENIVKTFMLTFGSALEEKLQLLAEQLIKCISYHIDHLPKFDVHQVAMAMDMHELIDPLSKALKSTLGQWLDDESLKSILTLTMESLQSHKINVDTSLQLLELFIAEIIAACNQSSPTYSV